MVKPTGAECNLSCDYCYFLPKQELCKEVTRMSDETLELYIKQLIEAHQTNQVTIAWQGGEPTIIGLEFYKKSVKLAKKYAKVSQKIEYTIQTNGTLLDENWCKFFKQNNFLVGLSLDGPAKYHNRFRSSHIQVVASLELLKKHDVEFDILCTVNSANADHPKEIYEYFRDELGVNYYHFIPIVEKNQEFTVSPEQYGRFLTEIFDQWIQNDIGKVFVRTFDNALASWVQAPQTACIFAPICGTSLIMMPNGDVYSCDHFVDDKHLLGNISENHLSDLVGSAQQRKFGQTKHTSLPSSCQECHYLFACNGGCPKNRWENKLNYLCPAYKTFFKHIDKSMQEMAELLRQGRAPAGIMNK
ncbi:anaerobic sulfatase maturase [Patescibacteria group bacterium]|nr:anaerobic sulfatase maturase [Patescibacteria group bacterium]MBU1673587.1 anaerobic sulfatase maturase [Patescibacteria group bacterium]MBU1963528.1 anaerobic sulfatase maturase [Patescibacteria group bacterium]